MMDPKEMIDHQKIFAKLLEGVVEDPEIDPQDEGVIYLTVTLKEKTELREWLTRMQKRNREIGWKTYMLLNPETFKFLPPGEYDIAILKGSSFRNADRTLNKIREKANNMGLVTPHASIACLVREQFSDAEIESMGFMEIVTVHEPIKHHFGYDDYGKYLLTIGWTINARIFDATWANPEYERLRKTGFVFLVPKK